MVRRFYVRFQISWNFFSTTFGEKNMAQRARLIRLTQIQKNVALTPLLRTWHSSISHLAPRTKLLTRKNSRAQPPCRARHVSYSYLVSRSPQETSREENDSRNGDISHLVPPTRSSARKSSRATLPRRARHVSIPAQGGPMKRVFLGC